MDAPYVLTRYDQFSIILTECPRVGDLLSDYGLHCANCFMNEYDTVENGAAMHGMTEGEMIAMIDEINTQLEQEWRDKNA